MFYNPVTPGVLQEHSLSGHFPLAQFSTHQASIPPCGSPGRFAPSLVATQADCAGPPAPTASRRVRRWARPVMLPCRPPADSRSWSCRVARLDSTSASLGEEGGEECGRVREATE